MIPVIDIVTDEVKTVNASDIAYVRRTGLNGSMINLVANNTEYRMLNNVEILRYLNDQELLVKSDWSTYINPTKVKKLDKELLMAEFESGKQASVSKMHINRIEKLLDKSE
ncbi:LytTR family transcriptional regulator DNA-binding domain-containing protein [Paenibacillus sp. USHLN196]|uniref:LytTR family transcriptional regulator DNA-binding domain-containing protein n=1 Tax=Paenibacillus sp. USHLN196 TaxID=3081291 RepID=UPI0030172BB0